MCVCVCVCVCVRVCVRACMCVCMLSCIHVFDLVIWHLPLILSVGMALVMKCVRRTFQRRKMCCYINCIFHKRSHVSTLFISSKAKHFVIKVNGNAHNEGFKRRLSSSFIIIISAYNNFVLQLKVLLLIRVETAIKKGRLTIAINQDYSKEYSKFSRSLLSTDVDSLLGKHL